MAAQQRRDLKIGLLLLRSGNSDPELHQVTNHSVNKHSQLKDHQYFHRTQMSRHLFVPMAPVAISGGTPSKLRALLPNT
ncbi:hypothetical protein PPTG_23730 [Phytophthora nicotianae INRA-310]|uniref:Uncharacterized protein n=2 Tax=Phytophthora nicotianae TaxID=4792 RepID=W2PSP7_PHYN3|nr:hypothetical protein PPTG_23730 [Phytophthora nicotianae INRA-310]ETN03671.1 hypothetical protein PPTG_23730 [Phytophthora nicotianae INRA-310]